MIVCVFFKERSSSPLIWLAYSAVEAKHDPRDIPGEVPLHVGTNDGDFGDQQHHRSSSIGPGAYLQPRELILIDKRHHKSHYTFKIIDKD